jgi:hypothetical protein
LSILIVSIPQNDLLQNPSPIIFYDTYLQACIHADLPPALRSKKLKPGIYLTFKEFLRNEPGVSESFRMVSQSLDSREEQGKGKYRLELLDSSISRRDKKKFWGACDGESVYVNELLYAQHFRFRKVQEVGRYCYFRGSYPSSSSGYMAGAMLGGVIGVGIIAATAASEGDATYILNINNGRIYQLEMPLLEKILSKDSTLANAYRQEKYPKKPEVMFQYLSKYNEQHVDEADLDRIQYAEVAFLRRGKSESAEPLQLAVDDTLVNLTPNSFFKMKSQEDSLRYCVNSECFTVLVEKKRLSYIQCKWQENDKPTSEKLKPEEGKFYLREVEVKGSRKK